MGHMGRKVIKKETLKMAQAFEYYYTLGDDRSLGKVAEHFGVTQTTIENWSTSFNWQERVYQRDMSVAQRMQEKTVKEIANTKANYRKIISVAVKEFVKKLTRSDEEGGCAVDLTKIQDLERLVKLDLLLMGEITERKDISGTQKVAAAVVSTADKEAAMALAKAILAEVNAADDDDEEVEQGGGS